MTRRDLVDAAALLVAATLSFLLLVVFAGRSCPATTAAAACPNALLNRVVVISLAAIGTGLLIAPFAFVAEFAVRRRIVFRGAWGRAARRSALAAFVVVALAGLRLGGALNAPLALFVLLAPVVLEVYLTRRELRS